MMLDPGDFFAGRFQLEHRLGVGGQAATWRAIDTELGIPVALKITSIAGCKRERLDRVRREAKLLSELKAPSVVGVHGLFEDPDLRALGLSLELIEGQSVESALHDPRFTEPYRLWVVLHVANGLSRLHKAGIVHRDIKPDNVMLGPHFFESPASVDEVKIIDFGVAMKIGNPNPLTRLDQPVGTAAYLPPELVAPREFPGSDDGFQDTRRDVWAFGVLAMTLLERGSPSGLPDGCTKTQYADRYRSLAESSEEYPPVSRTAYAPLWAACLPLHPEARAPDLAAVLGSLPQPPSLPKPSLPTSAVTLRSADVSSARRPPPPPPQPPDPSRPPSLSLVPPPPPRSQVPRPPGWPALVAGGTLSVIGVIAALVIGTCGDDPPPRVPRGPTSAPSSHTTSASFFVPAPVAPHRLTPYALHASSSKTGYPVESAFDNNGRTAWHEGVPGSGRGEWIEASVAAPGTLRRVWLTTGFDWHHKDEGDLFPLNAHLKVVSLHVDDRLIATLDVGPDERSATFADLHVPLHAGSRVRLVADDVWDGTRWDDLAITEVTFEGD